MDKNDKEPAAWAIVQEQDGSYRCSLVADERAADRPSAGQHLFYPNRNTYAEAQQDLSDALTKSAADSVS